MPCGGYRCVVPLGRLAIKRPRLSNFRAGLCCNRWEREMWFRWRPRFGWKNLCPVLFADPLGLVVFMPCADQPVTFDEVVNASPDCYHPDINVEYKTENWGRLEGRVVCLDYGLSDKESTRDRREYLSKFPPDHKACCEESVG